LAAHQLNTKIGLVVMTGDVDFGTTSTVLTTAQKALMPDVQTAPVFAFAYVAAYNVPQPSLPSRPIARIKFALAHARAHNPDT
jgi:ABC-type phosphate transport system substrate-binding protein